MFDGKNWRLKRQFFVRIDSLPTKVANVKIFDPIFIMAIERSIHG
jgi:hypothetical protein